MFCDHHLGRLPSPSVPPPSPKVPAPINQLYGRQIAAIGHAFAKLHALRPGPTARALSCLWLWTGLAFGDKWRTGTRTSASIFFPYPLSEAGSLPGVGVGGGQLYPGFRERKSEFTPGPHHHPRPGPVSVHHKPLTDALMERAVLPHVINTFNSQDIGNLTWAFASLGLPPPGYRRSVRRNRLCDWECHKFSKRFISSQFDDLNC